MAGKIKDLAGQRFGRLVAIRREKDSKDRTAWLCQCDCGNMHYAVTKVLTKGAVRSCGCLRKERQRKNETEESRRRKELMIAKWDKDKLFALFRLCTNSRFFKRKS